MKKIFLLFTLLLSACAFAKPIVLVSILPQETFVKKIAKESVDVITMVPPGSSPHSYEPKASQMRALSNAKLYFSIGVEFEHAWLKKFLAQNGALKIVDMNQNIQKIQMLEPHHHHNEAEHHEEEDGIDPHTWTSPKNVAIMARNIYEALVQIDPKNEPYFKKNLREFLSEIDATHTSIKKLLKKSPNKTFMVFHPSWGYFADTYGLTQIAVEVNGKNPKPKEMVMIIEEAKENKIKTIFTQPEFSDKSAATIAQETDAKLYKISPLAPNWSQNLLKMADALANN